MAESAQFKTGKTMTLALQILAVIDILAGLGMAAIALEAGWPKYPADSDQVGAWMLLLLALQVCLRTGSLVVMAAWSRLLVSNAQRLRPLKITPRWAWLGWFVPIVSFITPAATLWALNGGHGAIPPWRRFLIPAWWLMRMATCFASGFVIVLSGVVVAILIIIFSGTDPGGEALAYHIITWLAVSGIISHVLEFAVVTLTYRRQVKAGDVLAATVF